MHKKFKIFLYLVVCLCLLSIIPTSASPAFMIPDYNIQVAINKSAVFDVVETIQIQDCTDLVFYKDILQEYSYDVKGEGIEQTYAYKVSDIVVENGEVSTTHEAGKEKLAITISQPNAEVILSYTVRMRNFDKEDGIVLLYSLLQPSMQAKIENLQATITLPNLPDTTFDIFKIDANGMRGDALQYQLNDKTLSITSTESIEPGTGIMMQANLRKFYFDYSNPFTLQLFFSIFSIILVMGSYCLIVQISRLQAKKKQLIECYPLENMEIGTLGYIVDGVCDIRDIMNILIEWANQNYIQIRDENQTVTLVLINELPQNAPAYEKHLFDLLFTDFTYVTIDQLKSREMNASIMEVTREMYCAQNSKDKEPIFTSASYTWQIIGCILVCIPMGLTMFACTYDETYHLEKSFLSGFLSVLVVFGNCLPWVWVLKNQYKLSKTSLDVHRLLIGMINFLCGGLLYTYLLQHHTATVYAVIAITMTILFACVMIFMEKRTATGKQIYTRLLAMRHFIRRSNSEQLKSLLYDNPYYFEDMLPYACIFDVVDIWGKKFTSIPLQAPFWYFHPNANANSTIYWMSSLVKTLQDIQNALLIESSKKSTVDKQKKHKRKDSSN